MMVACAVVCAFGSGAGAQTAGGGRPLLDRETAMWLVAQPIACVDRLHEAPRGTGYLYEIKATIRPDFARTRAFYGCSDWHSAVHSTWAMAKILKTFPDLSIAPLIREKLETHLVADAIKGEVAFFSEEGNRSFERPYGWVWLLRLHQELKWWQDPQAQRWASNLDPLVHLFLERLPPYLKGLAAPMRIGTHANTAFSLKLLLDFARANGDKELEASVVDRARAFYAADRGCAPGLEVSGSDFFSPCLLEAVLMSRVLPQPEFLKWLGAFLPAPDASTFGAYTTAIEVPGTKQELTTHNLMGSKSHLIGLAITRAQALEELAAALPLNDPRALAYRRIADRQIRNGIDAMYAADYVGTHWLASFVLEYLSTQPAAGVVKAPR